MGKRLRTFNVAVLQATIVLILMGNVSALELTRERIADSMKKSAALTTRLEKQLDEPQAKKLLEVCRTLIDREIESHLPPTLRIANEVSVEHLLGRSVVVDSIDPKDIKLIVQFKVLSLLGSYRIQKRIQKDSDDLHSIESQLDRIADAVEQQIKASFGKDAPPFLKAFSHARKGMKDNVWNYSIYGFKRLLTKTEEADFLNQIEEKIRIASDNWAGTNTDTRNRNAQGKHESAELKAYSTAFVAGLSTEIGQVTTKQSLASIDPNEIVEGYAELKKRYIGLRTVERQKELDQESLIRLMEYEPANEHPGDLIPGHSAAERMGKERDEDKLFDAKEEDNTLYYRIMLLSGGVCVLAFLVYGYRVIRKRWRSAK